MNLDEIYEDTWEDKGNGWLLYPKDVFYRQHSVMLGIQKEWRN